MQKALLQSSGDTEQVSNAPAFYFILFPLMWWVNLAKGFFGLPRLPIINPACVTKPSHQLNDLLESIYGKQQSLFISLFSILESLLPFLFFVLYSFVARVV